MNEKCTCANGTCLECSECEQEEQKVKKERRAMLEQMMNDINVEFPIGKVSWFLDIVEFFYLEGFLKGKEEACSQSLSQSHSCGLVPLMQATGEEEAKDG